MSIKLLENEIWGFIPARGGSKSVPLKNLAPLAGRPLIEYAINATKSSRSISRIICSTDNHKIAAFCENEGIEVQSRPAKLSGDTVATLDVIVYFLNRILREEGQLAEMIALLEPTSPFLLPKHIDECFRILGGDKEADSIQTVTAPPPNHHAFNQRYLDNGLVKFCFPEERADRFNKQLKPEYYVHGNLRIFRSRSLLSKHDLFGDRSLSYAIDSIYAIDVDGPYDFELAECLINCGKVQLPHITWA